MSEPSRSVEFAGQAGAGRGILVGKGGTMEKRIEQRSGPWRALSREQKQELLAELRRRQQRQVEVELRRLHHVR